MDFRKNLRKVNQSRTTLVLAGLIVLVLFVIQCFALLGGLYGGYQQSIDEQIVAEQVAVESFLSANPSESMKILDDRLNGSLVGLLLFSESGNILLKEGNTSGFESDPGPEASQGLIKQSRWSIKTPSHLLTAVVLVDTDPVLMQTIWEATKLLLFSLLTSLFAGALILLFTFRYYIQPMDELVESLRNSRDNGESETPERIGIPRRTNLRPVANEINNLIEGQRKSARLVKVKQQYLEFAAHHDPLTHLPNRLMFEEALKKTVHSAVNEKRRFTMFLVDLDNFKHFNDRYGHVIGDKMVTEVANRLRTQISGVDVVARLDGDEFGVLQQDVSSISSTLKIAERIMSVISEPFEHQGFTLKTAVSVGIARFPDDVFTEHDEHSIGEEVVNNATVALYEAKSAGKGQFQLFNEKMRSSLTDRISLEEDLKVALQENQFEVYYQPKVNIRTKQCTGAEALVRWNHPVKGFVSPDSFVPLAEENGMIIELGEWILRTACIKMRDLQALGYTGLNVAVNISAVQFTDGNLLPMVTKALKDTQINPELLELEITESAVMHDPEEVIRSLHELSQHGMKLAIDDFGTGYSSLAYLKKFPVDTLKIDKAFITDVSSDNDDVAIVEAILGLGKHFNMKVVAEGIEEESQLEFLKAQGCDIAQGYLISKPLSASDYTQWLQSWPHGVQEAASDDTSLVDDEYPRTGTAG